jgi:DNA polymerase IV (DinB-like DNA polymerase)
MDSFYASCELSQRPELKNEPFVVGADPKEGKGRGVVLACNYPARKFGLHSGMPISRAWQLCPQAHYGSPHFELYEQISNRVMNLIQPFAERVEQVSIDEAYLEVTSRIESMKDDQKVNELDLIQSLADSIRKAVSEKENITCSIGVAESKIVAKIATDMNKPNGLTIVRPSEVLEFLAPLEVSRIPGVGTVSQKILLDKFQVKTISDLRKVPVEDLKTGFGKNAVWLMNVANGIDESSVVERWSTTSLSGETTFQEDEGDYSKIRDAMNNVASEVHGRAVKYGYLFRNVGIKIRFSGFETHTRSKSLMVYADSLEILNRETEKLLSEFYGSGRKVRLIGVRVSNLLKRDEAQLTLLDWER